MIITVEELMNFTKSAADVLRQLERSVSLVLEISSLLRFGRIVCKCVCVCVVCLHVFSIVGDTESVGSLKKQHLQG